MVSKCSLCSGHVYLTLHPRKSLEKSLHIGLLEVGQGHWIMNFLELSVKSQNEIFLFLFIRSALFALNLIKAFLLLQSNQVLL